MKTLEENNSSDLTTRENQHEETWTRRSRAACSDQTITLQHGRHTKHSHRRPTLNRDVVQVHPRGITKRITNSKNNALRRGIDAERCCRPALQLRVKVFTWRGDPRLRETGSSTMHPKEEGDVRDRCVITLSPGNAQTPQPHAVEPRPGRPAAPPTCNPTGPNTSERDGGATNAQEPPSSPPAEASGPDQGTD
jgi:hypothetical protein